MNETSNETESQQIKRMLDSSIPCPYRTFTFKTSEENSGTKEEIIYLGKLRAVSLKSHNICFIPKHPILKITKLDPKKGFDEDNKRFTLLELMTPIFREISHPVLCQGDEYRIINPNLSSVARICTTSTGETIVISTRIVDEAYLDNLYAIVS